MTRADLLEVIYMAGLVTAIWVSFLVPNSMPTSRSAALALLRNTCEMAGCLAAALVAGWWAAVLDHDYRFTAVIGSMALGLLLLAISLATVAYRLLPEPCGCTPTQECDRHYLDDDARFERRADV